MVQIATIFRFALYFFLFQTQPSAPSRQCVQVGRDKTETEGESCGQGGNPEHRGRLSHLHGRLPARVGGPGPLDG